MHGSGLSCSGCEGRGSYPAVSAGSVKEHEQPRVIDAAGAYAIVAGSMIGIGIFLAPPIVAQHIASPFWFLALWLFGGLTAFAGAVACAELGAMMPRAGGDYVFQYEAFGPSVAFASGWSLFGAIFSGSIATMSVGLCTYQLPVLVGADFSTVVFSGWDWVSITRADLSALALVPILTALNASGARPSARTQTVLTVAPIVLLALLAVWAIAQGPQPAAMAVSGEARAITREGLAIGYMAVYFAYSGWINVIYVAGEVEEPQGTIPRSLIWGTLTITVLYLLLCLGFLRVLGMEGLRTAGEAGTAMAGLLAGGTGRVVITALIACALLASINATILGGARVAYAMGQRGAGWRGLGTVQEGSGAPRQALWLQAVLAELLILSGGFEQLLTMVSLTMVLTGSLTVAAVFVLRHTRPEWNRPYRTTGYPLLPMIYIGSSVLALGLMLENAFSGETGAWYPLLGLALMGVLFAFHRSALSARQRQLD